MKYLPHGTQVTIDGQAIGGLIGVTPPNSTKGEAETTDTDSGGNRGWFPALREGDTLELTMRHDPDDQGQKDLRSNYEGDGPSQIVEFIVTLPAAGTAASGGQTHTFDGFVTNPPYAGNEQDLQADEVAEVTASVKVDGGVTVA